MNSVSNLSPDRLGILTALFSAATQEASTAMSRWTGGLVGLRLDEVRELPMECLASELDLGDEPLTMVVLSLDGELTGDMVLCFDDAQGRQLAATLLGRAAGESGTPWCDLEKSALTETGNILSCAYLNALTRFIGRKLVPMPPCFVQDYGASVLQQALMTQAAIADRVLICRTCFQRQGEYLQWSVFFVPGHALRGLMERAMDTSHPYQLETSPPCHGGTKGG